MCLRQDMKNGKEPGSQRTGDSSLQSRELGYAKCYWLGCCVWLNREHIAYDVFYFSQNSFSCRVFHCSSLLSGAVIKHRPQQGGEQRLRFFFHFRSPAKETRARTQGGNLEAGSESKIWNWLAPPGLSGYLSPTAQAYLRRGGNATVGPALLPQLTPRKSDRYGGRPSGWRQFLSWNPLFPNMWRGPGVKLLF